jgi:hypothetical protein
MFHERGVGPPDHASLRGNGQSVDERAARVRNGNLRMESNKSPLPS